jgi:hypothetical protein
MLSVPDQRVFLLQILNEVCNGFHIDDFEGTLGFSWDDAKIAWSKLKDGGGVESLSLRELSSLRRATILTMDELEDGVSEFQTRTGFELEDATEMLTLLADKVSGDYRSAAILNGCTGVNEHQPPGRSSRQD